MMLGILGNVWEYDTAMSICDRLVAALPSGSYVVINDGTNAVDPDAAAEAERTRAEAGDPYRLRTPDQITGFFHGLNLLEPGVVSVSRWRPETIPFGVPEEVSAYCGVAVKP